MMGVWTLDEIIKWRQKQTVSVLTQQCLSADTIQFRETSKLFVKYLAHVETAVKTPMQAINDFQ